MAHLRSRFGVAVLLLVLPLITGCGAGSSAVPATPTALNVSHSVPFDTAAFAVPNVAGTYDGTFTETIGGRSVSGTLVMTVLQTGSKISGTWKVTANGVTFVLNLAGSVSEIPVGPHLKFTLYAPHTRSASAHGNLIGKHLNGKAYVPPSGTKKAVYITFKTIQQ